MAKDKSENDLTKTTKKKNDKSLPGLIFLIGLALIIGGVLMQVGYFDTNTDTATPEAGNTSSDQSDSTDSSSDAAVDVQGGENIDDVDFSQTEIKDNESIPVKKDVEYTYGADFKMQVTELSVTCDDSGTCGEEGDQVVLKYTAGDKDYDLTLTPSENTQNLIDVPVSVEEWHNGYVVILMTRAG